MNPSETSTFWKATSADIQRTQHAIDTYLYVFSLDESSFLQWLLTDAHTLKTNMRNATIVELKRLENECFYFCQAKHLNQIAL